MVYSAISMHSSSKVVNYEWARSKVNYECSQSDTKSYGLLTTDSGLNYELARSDAKKLWSTDSGLWTKLLPLLWS
ncbi:hypothetical protein [uncultured Microscilla sp.]|uniref:hypothetical protein n=1 Tax=uncultured Microscilla sp. TaxID=432653 RepID=UPI002630178E|nr:hypothetical protein [uncultured Microscilla sp.]